jgi:hypothetical protein
VPVGGLRFRLSRLYSNSSGCINQAVSGCTKPEACGIQG